jgi:GNAT superfamily N-acetyltransferase
MKEITFEIVEDDDIEQCRELCDELMRFQRSMATIEPERFDTMDFDTRMMKSYETALEKQVVVAKVGNDPIGYVFSTVESSESMVDSPFGLLPRDRDLPSKVGCLSNLYLKREYRGTGIGSSLFKMSMDWLDGFPDIDRTFIFISNGNGVAYDFYRKRGFAYSHDVMGGFIKAMCKRR